MGTEQTSPSVSAPQQPPLHSSAAHTGRRTRRRIAGLYTLLTRQPISLYAVSVLRIGYGLLYLCFLLREFPHRDEIWGPGSPWTPALANRLFEQTGWNSVLTLFGGRSWFEVCYAMAVVTSALFMLGWRTRATSVLFAVMVASFHSRAIFMTDGGDNLILLMALYLVCTACGRRWSLDARRNRSRAVGAGADPQPGGTPLVSQLRDARDTLTTVVHNCALFVMAAQICVLYGSAGLYKVQGGTWGSGTALHYVLNLELFRPWPALSHLADNHAVLLAVAGYLTVLLQVAFPFVLFGRLKYPVLILMLSMHIGIAVFMGLPLFSGAMIVADAVFLPDRFYTAARGLCLRAARRALGRRCAQQHAHKAGARSLPAQGRARELEPTGQAGSGQKNST